jgi:hypothetical protein
LLGFLGAVMIIGSSYFGQRIETKHRLTPPATAA